MTDGKIPTQAEVKLRDIHMKPCPSFGLDQARAAVVELLARTATPSEGDGTTNLNVNFDHLVRIAVEAATHNVRYDTIEHLREAGMLREEPDDTPEAQMERAEPSFRSATSRQCRRPWGVSA